MCEKPKKKGLWIKILVIVLAVIVALLGVFYGAWHYLTKDITGEKYTPNESTSVRNDVIAEVVVPEGAEPSLPPELTDGIEDETEESITTEESIEVEQLPEEEIIVQTAPTNNLKANILAWKDAGQPAKADGVTNILLIGMDINSSNMNVNSRADAMVIVSINHNTKKITLASILRDQYCYVQRSNGGRFEKLHHANAYGGPELQIDMIEKYYKIAIDNYAVVNLYSVPKLVDAVGGVTVNINAAEAKALNKNYKAGVTVGENTLNGKNALWYMRIRYNTGGDTARVSRQQEVIKQLIKKMKAQSVTTLASLILEVDDYIRTGYSSNQMLSLTTDALVNGWFNYEIVQLTLPDSICAKSFIVNGGWYWKVDFPVAAQKLQMVLYGTTNIQLDPNRRSWL